MWVDELRRARARLDAALDDVAVGAISGAVGTHATVPPSIEEYVCAAARPAPRPRLHPDHPARPPCPFRQRAGARRLFAGQDGPGDSPPPAHRVGRGVRAVRRASSKAHPPCRTSATRRSAERVCGLARVLRGYAVTAMENVALWHERDISHSSAERIILPDATATARTTCSGSSTRSWPASEVDEARMRANLDLTRGLIYSSRILLALVEKGLDRQTRIQARAAQRAEGLARRRRRRGPARHAQSRPRGDGRTSASTSWTALADPSAYLAHIDTAFDPPAACCSGQWRQPLPLPSQGRGQGSRSSHLGASPR